MKHETINYVELPCNDFDAAQTFFGDVFGWKFESYGDQYLAFFDDHLDGGFYKSQLKSQTTNGSALVIFYSERLEETQAKVVAAGGRVAKETFEFPGGRRFHFCDPHGNNFGVWSDK